MDLKARSVIGAPREHHADESGIMIEGREPTIQFSHVKLGGC